MPGRGPARPPRTVFRTPRAVASFERRVLSRARVAHRVRDDGRGQIIMRLVLVPVLLINFAAAAAAAAAAVVVVLVVVVDVGVSIGGGGGAAAAAAVVVVHVWLRSVVRAKLVE